MSGVVGQVGARSGVVGSTTDSTQLDYEEGIFTLSVITYSGGSGVSLTNQNDGTYYNKYVKVGRIVTCSMFLPIDYNSATKVQFSGLPFDSEGGGPVTYGYYETGSSPDYLNTLYLGFGNVIKGTNDFTFFKDSNGGVTNSNKTFNVGLTYISTT